jgi:hypothetical protein
MVELIAPITGSELTIEILGLNKKDDTRRTTVFFGLKCTLFE